MRCSQPQGLPEEAEKFLEENAIKKNVCSKCGRYSGHITEKQEKTYGMFEEFNLLKYKLKSGGWAEEYIQYCYWSSGPVEFSALKLPDGTKIEWDKEYVESEPA